MGLTSIFHQLADSKLVGCAQSCGKLCGPRLFHLLFSNACIKKKKKKVRLYIFLVIILDLFNIHISILILCTKVMLRIPLDVNF